MKLDYIETDCIFKEYLDQLESEDIGIIALDIEAEYNLHQYGEKLCLIQICDGKRNVIVDPLAVEEINIIRLFESTSIRKIMFDASSDRTLIYKKYRTLIGSVIDLKPAADLLDLPKKDLASVVELFLGVGKNRNYQKYDWTKRPVTEGALEYAMNDVIYLFELRDRLFEALENEGLMDEYRVLNEQINTRKIDINRKPGFLRKPAFQRLKTSDRRKVEAVFFIRERYAETYNVPPHFIFSNESVIKVGTGMSSLSSVRLFRGLHPRDQKTLVDEIMEVLR